MSNGYYGSDHDTYAALQHFGVKGMKWGVRRANRKVEKELTGPHGFVKLHNQQADHFNAGIEKINSNPKYQRNIDFDTPLGKRYLKEVNDLQAESVAKAIEDLGYNKRATGFKVTNDRDATDILTGAMGSRSRILTETR